MSNTSTIHIKTDFDCKVYDYGQELSTAKADNYFNVELRKGEHELTFVYTEDESISKTISYKVEDADCDYLLIVEIVEVLCDKAKQLYNLKDFSSAFSLFTIAAEKGFAEAFYYLGRYYCEEKDDKVQAFKHFQISADKGNFEAKICLGCCYKHGYGTIRNLNKTIELTHDAAITGNIRAMRVMGFYYENVEQDYTKAIEWWSKAAEQGDAVAQNNLAVYYSYNTEERSEVIDWLIKAAEQGNAFAQYNLAICYSSGIFGVKKDLTKSIEWYTKSAEQRNASTQCHYDVSYLIVGPEAEEDFIRTMEWYMATKQRNAKEQYDLGRCYEYGDNDKGIMKDLAKAVEWYTKAAQQGYALAQDHLGFCYEYGNGVKKDLAKAAEWYTKAAEQGYALAQNSIGVCFYNGNGVEKDLARAVEWFAKAAKQGQHDAQCNLGICYYYGVGVEKDLTKAVECYSKAAEQGNTVAQYNLGVCYDDGEGVEKDFTKAVEWYTKAAEQGHVSAQYNLGICYKNGNGVEKDLAKAVEWYTKAAEQGHTSAQNNLGICYKNGNGVEKDLAKAVEWFTNAAEHGNAQAQYNLGVCYKNGDGVKKDLAKAVEWYTKAAEQGDEDAKKTINCLKSFETKHIHYLFFDTETTGLPIDYYTPTYQTKLWPRLVQLSWITTDEDCNILSQNDFIIYPDGFTIPSDASKLHGITTDIAKEKGKPLKEVIEKFMEDFKAAKAIVGHNIDFDKKIISAELYRLRQKDIMNSKQSLCTMKASTNYCKIPGPYGYKHPKLQELHKKLFGCEFKDAHNSMSDVTATMKCFKEMRRVGWI